MIEQQAHAKSGGPFAGVMAWSRRATAWVLATKPARAVLIYMERHGPMLADSVTYRTLFSVFAGIFLGFAIGGIWLSGNPDAMDALVATIGAAIPGLVGDDSGIISPDDLIQPFTLSITGSLALVGLVAAAIGAIGSLRTAFRELGDQPDDQTFFLWLVLRDLALAIGFGAALAIAAAVTFFSTTALETLFSWIGLSRSDSIYDVTTRTVSIIVIFAIDTVVIAAMFRVLSGLRPSARSLWTGAILGGIGLTVLQVLSSLFVVGATTNPLLASFGSLIALLLWFNFSSQVILIAAAYIITGIDDEHDRVHARHGAPTLAIRRMQRAERRATAAAAELAAARESVERERSSAASNRG
jgi:membrane protein